MNRLEQLLQMQREDPQDPFLAYAIALEHAKEGKRAQAISEVEKLLEEKPGYLGAYYQLGQWYEQEDKNEEAIRVYEKGISVAQQQHNHKALGELRTALDMIT
ncbi:MAG TPA: tetratricopeptide repeat protein [Bacteroidia bacterium]|nr:tetratricopeptide repeat protein [Bacteroidia bacterium]